MLYEPSQNTIYSGYMSDSHTSRTGHLSKSLSKYRYAPQVKYEEGVQCDKSMSNSNKSMGQKILPKAGNIIIALAYFKRGRMFARVIGRIK